MAVHAPRTFARSELLGFGTAVKQWGQLRVRSLDSFDKALKIACQKVLERAKYYTPVDTKHLRDSSYVLRDTPGVYEIVFPAFYAPYVHENENAYHAPPTGARFLARAVEELWNDFPRMIGENIQFTFGDVGPEPE